MQLFRTLAKTYSWTRLTMRGVKSVDIISRSIQSELQSQYNVRGATENDFTQIWNLIQSHEPSWPTDPHFMKIVLEVFPGRIVVGEDMTTKNIVGICSSIPVNNELGIACLYLVHKEVRSKGLGQQMVRKVIQNNGDMNIVLDSVPDLTEWYEKVLGYRKLSGLTFWNGKIRHEAVNRYDGNRNIEVKEVTKSSVPEIIKYDEKIYPVCRDWFIERCVFEKPGIRVRIAVENEEVVGYGFTRPPPNNFHMSSLYANDADIARRIFSSAIFDVPEDSELTLFIPDDNKHASAMAIEIGLKPVERLTRMVSKKSLQFPWSQIFFATPADFVLY